MRQVKELMYDIIYNGEWRETRTGEVLSVWNRALEFDLSEGFPAVTSKRLPFGVVVGELLWFLSGSKHTSDLKHYTYGDSDSDKWTIWTDDAKRWNTSTGNIDEGFVGDLYPVQWRNYNNSGVDQIANLIQGLRYKPMERGHVVMAWNPEAIDNNSMALKPCHMSFQCYVTVEGKINLHWGQRSVDSFLGLPFNISSYALLTHMLAEVTGLEVGKLSATLMDVHLYGNHMEQVDKYLSNDTHHLPTLAMPEFTEIDDALQFTAKDFTLKQYLHSGVIKAPLSVGT